MLTQMWPKADLKEAIKQQYQGFKASLEAKVKARKKLT